MNTQAMQSSLENDLVIFYADDDQDDLDTFKDAVEDLNNSISVHTHLHGENLMHALQNPPPAPHMVFLDLNMPRKSGFEVLEEIRDQERFRNLPIVVVSTSDDEQTIARCRELGANLYIPKPTDYGLLKRSVSHALHINWESFKPNKESFVYRNN